MEDLPGVVGCGRDGPGDRADEAGYPVQAGGAPGGYGALMYSNADGTKTLTAGITMGESGADPAEIFPQALDTLVRAVFTA